MDKTKIIDYLYGEMSSEEEKAFEEQLKKDPELRSELDSFRNMQGFLQDHHDEIPTGQPILLSSEKKKFYNSRWWAIAASVALLLVGGKLLDVRVSMGNSQFTIQFGEPDKTEIESRKDELQKINQLANSIDLLKQDLLDRMDAYDAQLKDSGDQFNKYQVQMASLADDLRNDQADLTLSLWEQFKADQKEHTELLVDDFVEYVEFQRQQDLKMINESMNNLAQLIQMETDQKPQYVYQPIQK